MKNLQKEPKQKEALDFASGALRPLFRKMFFPTLMGMISMVALNLADGAFVGHGAGTEALAAVNIAAPIFNLMIGLGIMFGIGTSVISSIHLSQNNIKAARINTTQALLGSCLVTGCSGALILCNLADTCRLFGSNEELIPLASSYLKWVALFLPLCITGNVGSFIIRLDGSPKYAMACTLLACLLNIFLDWLFVFPFHWGLEGAAIATSISFSISALVVLYYLLFKARTLHLYPVHISFANFLRTIKNLIAQVKMGFSAMLGEIAIAYTMIVGNFVFIHYLGKEGVAAYGVICYCMPVIFMWANAITQAIQPILSFAHGKQDLQRLQQAKRIGLRSALTAGICSTLILTFGARWITLIFIPAHEIAYTLCVNGLQYFGIAGLFICLNLVLVGYLQSIEQSATATLYSLLRGFLIITPCFIFLPQLWGVSGIWLAIPVAEALTLAVMFLIQKFTAKRKR